MTTWIELAGWTLLHFLWQGAIVWAIAAAALRAAAAAQTRHAIACTALAALLAAPLMTAWTLSDRGRAISAIDGLRLSPAPSAMTAGVSSTAAVTPALPWNEAAADHSGSPAARRSALSLVVAIWLCGVAVLLARLAVGCWRIRRLRNAAFDDSPSRWQAAADTIARRLHLRRPVFVVDSNRVDTPTVIGWLRPVIVLPLAAMANLAPAQVEAILAHELAHIRRHDFLVNVLQTFAETLLFYHPAVWSISNRIRAEREHCCDDVAVDVCGDPVTYAAALTELAAWSVARRPLALAATSGPLIGRIRRLLASSSDDAPRTSSRLLTIGVVLALLLIAGSVGAISLAQVGQPAAGTSDAGRLGPPDVNKLLGFELFPGRSVWPTNDPREGRAWGLTVASPAGDVAHLGFTARSLIRHAYGAVGVPIADAPAWLDRETFDLRTSVEVPITDSGWEDTLRVAVRRLLEQRLGLAVHREQREFPVYALVKANADGRLGPDIAVSSSNCFDAGMSRRVFSRRWCGIDNDLTGIRAERVTMAEFAADIRGSTPLAPDLPVVDRTGLADKYDFRITFGFLPIAAIASGHPLFGAAVSPLGFRTMFTALPEQLGLKLEKSTAPFEVLVIDEVHRPQP
jgi:uncharacterized protein (TIGR03435 family)